MFTQVSKEDEGKLVDSNCHKLTASFVRERHKSDSRVPICLFYEVQVEMNGLAAYVVLMVCTGRNLMSEEEDMRYLQESMIWCVSCIFYCALSDSSFLPPPPPSPSSLPLPPLVERLEAAREREGMVPVLLSKICCKLFSEPIVRLALFLVCT